MKTRYGLVVYHDPGTGDEPVKVKYTGRQAIDAGAFYVPYIPLQTAMGAVWRMKHNRASDSRRWWWRLWDGSKPALVFRNALKARFNRARVLMTRMVFHARKIG